MKYQVSLTFTETVETEDRDTAVEVVMEHAEDAAMGWPPDGMTVITQVELARDA